MHGVVDQPPGQVQLADAAAAPVDDLRRQHAADAQLLAEAEQHDVDAGRVDVGQLGQVADAHHHLGLGIAAAHFEIAAQRGREAEADRLDHRVDAERHAPAGQRLDGASSPSSVAGTSGTATTSQPQERAASTLLLLTLSTSSAPAFDRGLDLGGVEAVDRDAQPLVAQRPTASPTPVQVTPGSQPRSITSAPSSRRRLRLGQQLVERQPRGVVDLGEDGDVVGAVIGGAVRLAAEEVGQVAQVLRAALDRARRHGLDGRQVAAAQAGQDDAVDAGGHGQMPGDPGRRRQGGDGDRQHRDAVARSRPAGARLASVRRRAGSASLPVTTEMHGRMRCNIAI